MTYLCSKEIKLDSVRVIGKDFKILNYDIEGDDINIGLVDVRAQVIKVLDTLNEDTYNETVLHESIHAIDELIGLKMSERQVHALSSCLFSFIRDNKVFIKKIHGKKNSTKSQKSTKV